MFSLCSGQLFFKEVIFILVTSAQLILKISKARLVVLLNRFITLKCLSNL